MHPSLRRTWRLIVDSKSKLNSSVPGGNGMRGSLWINLIIRVRQLLMLQSRTVWIGVLFHYLTKGGLYLDIPSPVASMCKSWPLDRAEQVCDLALGADR